MRKYADLKVGKTYKNKNGITYTCTGKADEGYWMLSEGGYSLCAHNITLYDNGSIEWDYSTNGKFVENR